VKDEEVPLHNNSTRRGLFIDQINFSITVHPIINFGRPKVQRLRQMHGLNILTPCQIWQESLFSSRSRHYPAPLPILDDSSLEKPIQHNLRPNGAVYPQASRNRSGRALAEHGFNARTDRLQTRDVFASAIPRFVVIMHNKDFLVARGQCQVEARLHLKCCDLKFSISPDACPVF